MARARAQASALAEQIRELGGEPVEAPVLRIEHGDRGALRAALHDLGQGAYTVVCLTSPNGVDAVADAIEEDDLDARVFAGVPVVACVGSGTAARLWERLRVRPDLVPERATTESLGEAVPPGSGRVLLPRADIASEILHRMLVDKGYEPVEVTAYRTTLPEALPDLVLDDLAAGRIDLLAFASSSTVRNFVTLVGDRPWQGAVVSIGPVTSRTCRELGIPVAVEADPHDLDGLVAALVDAAASDR
ncbi:MAG: uroporphyrinogen-III synthase [Egicoccus sp.]